VPTNRIYIRSNHCLFSEIHIFFLICLRVRCTPLDRPGATSRFSDCVKLLIFHAKTTGLHMLRSCLAKCRSRDSSKCTHGVVCMVAFPRDADRGADNSAVIYSHMKGTQNISWLACYWLVNFLIKLLQKISDYSIQINLSNPNLI
jgi:hypothetical protein